MTQQTTSNNANGNIENKINQINENTKLFATETQSQSQSQSFHQKLTDFSNIGLDVVQFNRSFSRNRGTLSQIVKSLEDMRERLSSPSNDYQKELYPVIQEHCKDVIDKYNELLSCIDPSNNSMCGYYLNGPLNNGKRKATTTPHEIKSYGVSEYKESLKSINDRLRHIKFDCQKNIKEHTKNDPAYNTEGFVKMIEFTDLFHKHIIEKLDLWNQFIVKFRGDRGIVAHKVPHKNNVKHFKNKKSSPQSPQSPQSSLQSSLQEEKPVEKLSTDLKHSSSNTRVKLQKKQSPQQYSKYPQYGYSHSQHSQYPQYSQYAQYAQYSQYPQYPQYSQYSQHQQYPQFSQFDNIGMTSNVPTQPIYVKKRQTYNDKPKTVSRTKIE
jgi:hypothetical protein